MDLNEILVFVRVVQEGSFNGAAKRLGMPNSTVSAKVSALEVNLGVTLLHRTTRKLHVTPAGQKYFERCLAAIEALQTAQDEAVLNQTEPQGALRITAPSVLGTTLLPEVISTFRRLYPKVHLDFILTDREVDLIQEQVDVAIRTGELSDSTLIAKRLGTSYFAPFARASYLKAHGTPKHPRDLLDHTCLVFAPLASREWTLVNRTGTKIRVPIGRSIVSDDLNLVKELALRGEGVALLPTFLCDHEARQRKIDRILPDWRTETRPISFVYPPRKFGLPKLQLFVELASEILRGKLRDSQI